MRVPLEIEVACLMKNLTGTNPICATLVYAIIIFRSVSCAIISLTASSPEMATTAKIVSIQIDLKRACTTSAPNPPNFNNTPARIIEPNTGASTCAIGSQR
jgi:hypothetical protein